MSTSATQGIPRRSLKLLLATCWHNRETSCWKHIQNAFLRPALKSSTENQRF